MLYVTVHLYGKNRIRGEFREYESKALSIFRKHGGEDENRRGGRRHSSIGLYGKAFGGRGFQVLPEILLYTKAAFVSYEIE